MTVTESTARVNRGNDLHASIVAHRCYRLAAVACDCPLLIAPLGGFKRIHAGGRTFEAGPGRFLMVHKAVAMDVENIPDAAAPYRAFCVSFPWHVVDMARQLIRQPVPRQAGVIGTGVLDVVAVEVDACGRTMDDDPATLDYRRLGLLLALQRHGHDGFLAAADPGLASRVRLMVAADPARDWTSTRVEAAFHVSGATLRRRLADEGTSLRASVRDARMHAALAMLQSGTRPLKSVAAAVGYRSVTSFRHRFFDRFGVEPAVVAHPRDR